MADSDPAAEPTKPLAGLITARLARIEVAMLARVLVGTLSEALPAGRVRAERRRSLGDVLRRRPGVVVGVEVRGADRVLSLRVLDVDDVRACIAHEVRGVTLSRRDVTVAEWIDELATVLDRLAAEDRATQSALRRALL